LNSLEKSIIFKQRIWFITKRRREYTNSTQMSMIQIDIQIEMFQKIIGYNKWTKIQDRSILRISEYSAKISAQWYFIISFRSPGILLGLTALLMFHPFPVMVNPYRCLLAISMRLFDRRDWWSKMKSSNPHSYSSRFVQTSDIVWNSSVCHYPFDFPYLFQYSCHFCSWMVLHWIFWLCNFNRGAFDQVICSPTKN
jgi:hypothetical protein